MKKIYLSLILALNSLGLMAQSQWVMKIDGEPISKAYFQYVYDKSNALSEEKMTPMEYMKSFIDFQLKVKEARVQKMDTLSSFKSEVNNYRDGLKGRYLLDEKAKQEMMRQIYKRTLQDVDVSHILIAIKYPQSAKDTLEAYKKAEAVIARLKSTPFDSVAVWMSDDPTVRQNFGHLGYLSAMKVVAPFENAIYENPVGLIGKPVRTMYGYHVIRINAKRDVRFTMKVAHVMKEFSDSISKNEAKKQIFEAYSSLLNGESFASVAKRFSDDVRTRNNGGELDWMPRGRTQKDFENAVYGLDSVKQFSEPFATETAWHIVTIVDRKPVASFDARKNEIEQFIFHSDRRAELAKDFVVKLKKSYAYKEDVKAIAKINKQVEKLKYKDSIFFSKNETKKTTVFSFANQQYLLKDLIAFMKKNNLSSAQLRFAIDAFAAESIYRYEDEHLEQKYDSLRCQMQEFRDGVLLFNVMEKEVWSKGSNDTVSQRRIFDLNRQKYTWKEPRFKGRVIYCKDESTARIVKAILSFEKSEDVIDERLRALNEKSIVVKSERGLYARGLNKVVDALHYHEGEYTLPEEFSVAFLHGEEVVRPESFLDVRGQVVQDYQNNLEVLWLKELHKKYNVELNYAELDVVQ